MVQQLSNTHPVCRVLLEALVQKITSLLADKDIGRNGYLILYYLYQLLLAGNLEGIFAHQHLVKHNTQRPNVYFLVILLPLQDLRAHIQGCPTKGSPERVVEVDRPSKIAKLDHILS